jgi:FixJ family two-component response regulator
MMHNERRVCIVDDDEAIRESLRLLLYAAGISSHVFPSANEFIARDEDWEFDCMLLDIRMPGMDGLQLFRQLIGENAPYPIIFITGHGDIPLAVSAIKQGAYDFLTKPFEKDELLDKVKSAISSYQQEREQLKVLAELNGRQSGCTPREWDVMNLMVQGLPNKGIADRLDISPRTVEIHRAHVMEKMEAESLPALVRMIALLEASQASE